MVIETHGAYGEISSPPEPNWRLVLENRDHVREVIIHTHVTYGRACGIEFVVTRRDGYVSHLKGFKDVVSIDPKYASFMQTRPMRIVFDSDEYLTQIHGTYDSLITNDFPDHVISIGICTNLRRYGPFGEHDSKVDGSRKIVNFESPPLSEDDSIVEIISFEKTNWIPNIGIRTRKVSKVCGAYLEGPNPRDPNWRLLLDNNGERVIEVIIQINEKSGYACGIEFVVARRDGYISRHLIGFKDNVCPESTFRSRPEQIIFDSHEFLTQIHGTYLSASSGFPDRVESIGICTNLRRYGPFGYDNSSHNIRLPNSPYKVVNFETPPLSDDDSIVEIVSLQKTDWLTNIGLRIKKGSKEAENIVNIDIEEKKGSLAFFATYRPPVPLDIYSAKFPPMSPKDEELMTDSKFYNYNGQVIPPAALKTILQRPLLRGVGTDHDVDSGSLSGMIFVSERTGNLETLHIALLFRDEKDPKVQVFNFAQVYDTFKGVRMEDSGCIAGDYLIYVSTMEPNPEPHQPWTAVYKTHLRTGKTDRLTPKGQADMSPSVSPDGKRIAVATLQIKAAGWDGEVEDLRTSICVMDVEDPLNREFVVVDGGWPTWGSNNVLFFHRNVEKVKIEKRWGVFRVHLHEGPTTVTRVTPEEISAMTPAAIDETRVAVSTLCKRFQIDKTDERGIDQYRHIEVFDTNKPNYASIEITQKTKPKADHFNPFVIDDYKGGKRIGYHRCHTEKVNTYNTVEKDFYKLQSPDPDLGVFRVSGVFPSISECGKKLAFVDNEFKAVWVADDTGLHMVYNKDKPNSVFSPVWNRKKDVLYVSVGPAFKADPTETVQIVAINDVSTRAKRNSIELTLEGYNSAFPSSNPDGTKLVYRSTKDNGHKNLYIMERADIGEKGKITRLTEGNWTDTHCQWSPRQDWIVFSSNRSYPTSKKREDLPPDGGYFAVYIVKVDDKNVVVKVIDSGYSRIGGMFAGHVNHPCFSPDGKHLVLTADLAGVSCEPVSMPLFVHSVRPYGDIFIIDIDPDDIYKNSNVKWFTRVTHSRYENATATWTIASTKDLHKKWKVNIAGNDVKMYSPKCPFVHQSEAESFHMTGHLLLQDKHGC